jgi:hypothetical protein
LFLSHVCRYVQAPKKQPKASEPQPSLKPNTTHDVRTYWWYRRFVQSFCDLYGGLLALDVKPLHLTAWLDSHPKWTTSRRCAVICLKRVQLGGGGGGDRAPQDAQEDGGAADRVPHAGHGRAVPETVRTLARRPDLPRAAGRQTVLPERGAVPLPQAPGEAAEGVISYTVRHSYITDAP